MSSELKIQWDKFPSLPWVKDLVFGKSNFFYKYNLLCSVETDFENRMEIELLGDILLKCLAKKGKKSQF